MGVEFYVCQPSLDLHGLCQEDLIDGVAMIGGPAFKDMALEADQVICFSGADALTLQARHEDVPLDTKGAPVRRGPGRHPVQGLPVRSLRLKAPGGLIRCIAAVRDDHLEAVAFSGDFAALPASVPNELDAALVGCELGEAARLSRVNECKGRLNPEIPGISPGDRVAAVPQAITPQVPA